MDILSLFACFQTLTATATIRQLSLISQAILTMTGRVTMLRDFPLDWWKRRQLPHNTAIFCRSLAVGGNALPVFSNAFVQPSTRIYFGWRCDDRDQIRLWNRRDRDFFSGVLGKAVRGLEFFVFSLCCVQTRKAYPLLVKQTIRSAAEVAAIKSRKKKKKKQVGGKKQQKKLCGRPAGVKNKDKTRLQWSDELLRISALLKVVLKLLRVFLKVNHLVLDGHFGHNQAVLMAQEQDLHLISKRATRCRPVWEIRRRAAAARAAKKIWGAD